MRQPDAKTVATMSHLLDLAHQCEGGSRADAARFLKRMLARHRISISDIADDKQERVPVCLRGTAPDDGSLMLSLVLTWLYKKERSVLAHNTKAFVLVDMTQTEHAEIIMNYAVLHKRLQQYMKDAMRKFLEGNMPSPRARDTSEPASAAAPQDIETIRRMLAGTRRSKASTVLPIEVRPA